MLARFYRLPRPKQHNRGEGSGSIYRIRMNEDTSTFLPYEHQEKPLDFFPKVYIYHTTVD